MRHKNDKRQKASCIVDMYDNYLVHFLLIHMFVLDLLLKNYYSKNTLWIMNILNPLAKN